MSSGHREIEGSKAGIELRGRGPGHSAPPPADPDRLQDLVHAASPAIVVSPQEAEPGLCHRNPRCLTGRGFFLATPTTSCYMVGHAAEEQEGRSRLPEGG